MLIKIIDFMFWAFHELQTNWLALVVFGTMYTYYHQNQLFKEEESTDETNATNKTDSVVRHDRAA
ncbi:hypothetical protein ACRYI5_00955 [Furfurilactobacillus sp. WILCCON 0119]